MSNIGTNGRYGISVLLFVLISLSIVSLLIANVPSKVEGKVLYPDHPLPAYTGRFGELGCNYCHFESPVNPPDGRLTLERTRINNKESIYIIRVIVEHPEMLNAGFQLSARESNGKQAGRFHTVDERSIIAEYNTIQYVHHTLEGTTLVSKGKSIWEFQWKAPTHFADDTVFIHISAVAGNDDRSEFGDYVYMEEFILTSQ